MDIGKGISDTAQGVRAVAAISTGNLPEMLAIAIEEITAFFEDEVMDLLKDIALSLADFIKWACAQLVLIIKNTKMWAKHSAKINPVIKAWEKSIHDHVVKVKAITKHFK